MPLYIMPYPLIMTKGRIFSPSNSPEYTPQWQERQTADDIFDAIACRIQSLHCTDLGSLFLNHSCHGSQTYQCSHQGKDNEGKPVRCFSFCLHYPHNLIFRRIIAVRYHPFRHTDIIDLIPGHPESSSHRLQFLSLHPSCRLRILFTFFESFSAF